MDLDPAMLIGAKRHDPADVRPCGTRGSLVIGSGLSVHDWEAANRLVPAPPGLEEGPFAELRLAPNPAAAVAAAIERRRVGSEQPIWSVVRDVLGSAFYSVDAAGVRIKNCSADSRLSGGSLGLRREGEAARYRLEERRLVSPGNSGAAEEGAFAPLSRAWATLAAHFEETVAAVEIPADSTLWRTKPDWCLIVSVPRVRALEDEGSLRFHYLGVSAVRLRDLWSLRDVDDRWAGGRFAIYLARELLRDLFSLRRQQRPLEWLRFTAALLGFASGVAWLLSELASAFA